MSEGQRGSAYHYEEQRSLAEHHSGGGVHPHGSADCSGNNLMYEMCDVRCQPFYHKRAFSCPIKIKVVTLQRFITKNESQ